jgi:hypothetical protein
MFQVLRHGMYFRFGLHLAHSSGLLRRTKSAAAGAEADS